MYPNQPTPQPPTTNGQEPPFVPPTSPFVEPNLQPNQPAKGGKGKLALIIIGVIVLVFGTGAAAFYKFWYQAPDKVVTDAIVSTMLAKSATVKSQIVSEGEMPLQVAINGSATRTSFSADVDVSGKADDKDYVAKTSVLFDNKGDIYLKARNLAELVTMLPKESDAMQKAIDEFVTKVDNNWVRLPADDMNKTFEPVNKTQSCVQKATDAMNNDNSYAMEIYNAYEQHRFIKVVEELGTKDGSIGYVIDGDFETFKSFAGSVKETRLFKMLHDCDNSIDYDPSTFTAPESTSNDRIEIWADRWSHNLTAVNIMSEEKDNPSDKLTVMTQVGIDAPVTIEAPSQSLSVDDVSAAFQNLMMAFYSEPTSLQSNPSGIASPFQSL